MPVEEFQSKCENVKLCVDKPGDLNSVNWIEMSKDEEHGIPITVRLILFIVSCADILSHFFIIVLSIL